ncbi:MAG: universal stress protein [Nitrospiraceae bacterium]
MNVVVAVDGSKYSRWAVEWAQRMPLRHLERMTAVHVVDVDRIATPLVPTSTQAWHVPYLKKETARLQAHARTVMRETKRALAGGSVKAEVVLAHGPIATEVLAHAKGANTLVVLGSRGLDALDRVMLGSVSTKVVHHAIGPVLIVKEPPRRIRQILLAVDGSPASDKALRFLIQQMQAARGSASGVEVALLYAMPLLRYPELKDAGHELVARAAVRLEAVGYRVEPLFKIGQPADEVLSYAERHKVDLIVTGARGRGAIARFLLGSVSTKLVQHSHTSILIVR